MDTVINNWEIIFAEKGHNKQETRKKSFCKDKLDKFVVHGLNVRMMDFEWI